jgi:hypothetical protein
VTTNIDTLHLTYRLLPEPAGVHADIDTMEQLINLSWHEVPEAAVRGYLVTRKTARDPAGVWRILTATPVKDTVFTDSSRWKYGEGMLAEGDSCLYRIAAVDTQGICGKVSIPQLIIVRSPWQIRKTITVRTGVNLNEYESSLCQGIDDMLYAAWSDVSWVYRIDPISQVVEKVFHLGPGIAITDIIQMHDSTFIIAAGSVILGVSKSGGIQRVYPVPAKRIALVNNNQLCFTVADLSGPLARAVDNLMLTTGQTMQRYTCPWKKSISSIAHTGKLICMFERDKENAFGLYAVEPSGAPVNFKTEKGEEEIAVSQNRIAVLSGISIRMLTYSDTMIKTTMDRLGVSPDAVRVAIIDEATVCVLYRNGKIHILSKKNSSNR